MCDGGGAGEILNPAPILRPPEVDFLLGKKFIMYNYSLKSSFNGFLLVEVYCFLVEWVFCVVCKYFGSVGWYSDCSIAYVDLSFAVPVEEVDD